MKGKKVLFLHSTDKRKGQVKTEKGVLHFLPAQKASTQTEREIMFITLRRKNIYKMQIVSS